MRRSNPDNNLEAYWLFNLKLQSSRGRPRIQLAKVWPRGKIGHNLATWRPEEVRLRRRVEHWSRGANPAYTFGLALVG